MNNKVLNCFHGAMNNQSFLSAVKEADNDEVDHWNTGNDIGKTIWATMYYGWLTAKYGIDWQSHVNDKS
jgi:predicted 3-demethylubiquinone-9 3-methyltransferase (glyoxalase superfamily)